MVLWPTEFAATSWTCSVCIHSELPRSIIQFIRQAKYHNHQPPLVIDQNLRMSGELEKRAKKKAISLVWIYFGYCKEEAHLIW